MGTRADFYIGTGPSAEWLGSIAWDGYIEGIPDSILQANGETAYREAVLDFISSREDGTKPEDGWPWPWDDSCTTDCCYALIGDKVQCGSWGTLYSSDELKLIDEGQDPPGTAGNFPNMKDRKSAQLFGPRSGLIVLG